MNPNDKMIEELRADGHVVLLSFEAESSKLSLRFQRELTTLLSAAPKRPLIYTTANNLLAVYKSATAHVELSDANGKRFRCAMKFADAKGRDIIKFTTDAESIAQGDGTWAAGRTPESVFRHELPVFNAEVVTRALTELVDAWTARGELVEPKSFEEIRAEYRASQPKMPSEEEQVAALAQTPIADLDPNHPVRWIPGMLNKVREYRRAHGLDSPQIPDPRANRSRA